MPAECGENNGVKCEKSRLPATTKKPPVRLNVTDVCSGDPAGAQINKRRRASSPSPRERHCFLPI